MKRLIGILALALAIGLTGVAEAAPNFDGSSTLATALMGASGTNTTLSGATSFSISAWVRITQYGNPNGGEQRVVSFGTGSGSSDSNRERASLGLTATGKLALWVLKGHDSSTQHQGVIGNSTVPLSTWVHIAGTVDFATGTMTVYKDGAADGTRTGVKLGTGFDSTPSTYARVASSPRTNYPNQLLLVGNVEDLQIYRSALTAGQVFGLTTLGAVEVGVASRYPLNCLAPDTCHQDPNNLKWFYLNNPPGAMADSAGSFAATPDLAIVYSEPGPTGGL